MKNKKYFKTNDFCLASYILAKNISLINIVKNFSGKATFIFLKNQECRKLIDEFSHMRGRVEPLSFIGAQKKLKHLIYLKQ